MWKYRGQERPAFALEPNRYQESVWDFPRPPRLDADSRTVVVQTSEGEVIAETKNVLRLCETASPPQFYVPFADIKMDRLQEVPSSSFCEWKGEARYWTLKGAQGAPIAWDYPDVNQAYAELFERMAFYPNKIECFVNHERVTPQPGEFYGGWITADLAGPFKGEPGTGHW